MEVSEKVPVAVNCWLVPGARLWPVGVSAIDTRAAGVTVKVIAGEVTLPSAAVIWVVPAVTGCVTPAVPAALLMVATAGLVEVQVTWVVRFCVELSEYVPVAVKVSLLPSATLGAGGVIAIDTSVADVTVTVVVPARAPQTLATLQVTVIVAVPVPRVLTSPLLLTVAAEGFEDVQVRSALKFCVEVSEKVPVAVNC